MVLEIPHHLMTKEELDVFLTRLHLASVMSVDDRSVSTGKRAGDSERNRDFSHLCRDGVGQASQIKLNAN